MLSISEASILVKGITTFGGDMSQRNVYDKWITARYQIWRRSGSGTWGGSGSRGGPGTRPYWCTDCQTRRTQHNRTLSSSPAVTPLHHAPAREHGWYGKTLRHGHPCLAKNTVVMPVGNDKTACRSRCFQGHRCDTHPKVSLARAAAWLLHSKRCCTSNPSGERSSLSKAIYPAQAVRTLSQFIHTDAPLR